MEEAQDVNTSSWSYQLKAFIKECGRVIKITKKPTMKEYKTILLVSGAGILLIGAIGFVIHMIKQLIVG